MNTACAFFAAEGASNTITTPSPAVAQSSFTAKPSPTSTPSPNVDDSKSVSNPSPEPQSAQDLIILSIVEGGYYNLFAYHPQNKPLTRLTDGPWDDIDPDLSPDGKRLAFASNRDGQWDLYSLDLATGSVSRLTNTPQYDSAPSWSPDGMFIAYETYLGENLKIAILSLDGDAGSIVLDEGAYADFSPAWSPQGRQIAFVSNRSGQREIWLADLDKVGRDRYKNLSRNPLAVHGFPAWSPDGRYLAWSAVENGQHDLNIWEEGEAPHYVGSGVRPVWSPDGTILLTELHMPNQFLLTAYEVETSTLFLPPVRMPGPLSGLTWGASRMPAALPQPISQAAALTPTPLWSPLTGYAADTSHDPQRVVSLQDVEAPYPMLHDLVDESFYALRERVAGAAGWDLLSTLENAFVPLSSPLPPGMGNDWLYTGRAFALNTLAIDAGWMTVLREEFGADTYWRVYVRARFQDGSQGSPLKDRPWDFSARFSGAIQDYEQGGRLSDEIPPGYWVDFTELAFAYGWHRLPALPTWRSSFPASRLNQYVLSGGLDWRSAVVDIYPPEVLITPTLFIPPTVTPTNTPLWYRAPTETPTPNG